MNVLRKRRISLLAGVMIEILVGVNYAYSVFQQPLMQKYGWTVQETALGYTVYFVVVLFSTLFLCEKVKKGMGIKRIVRWGALFYGLGVFMMSFIQKSPYELYLYFGVFAGFGCIMISPSITAYAMKLFPEKPGFAGGCTTAGYGMGAILWAPFVSKITETAGDIKYAFLFLGLLFLACIFAASMFLFEIPQNVAINAESKRKQKSTLAKEESIYDVDRKGMFRLTIFYKTMYALIIVFICGTMIITQASPMLQDGFGVSSLEASVVVSLCALTNTVGRSVWGWLSDRVGQIRILLVTHIFLIVFQTIILSIENKSLFILSLLGITFCFGGASSLVAPMTRKIFGNRNLEKNYSVTFSSFAISGIVGSFLISFFRQNFGSFSVSFAFCNVLSLVALCLMKGSLKLERNENRSS